MRESISRIIRYGIFSNTLKIIALICMVIDHIAYYFGDFIPASIYEGMRVIGRSAMPIFVFLLVQGFFKTKNFKKYIIRISVFAAITQIGICICAYINKRFFDDYVIDVYFRGNILFSFAITLALLKIIHEPIIIKKITKDQNLIVKIILVIILMAIYTFVPLDHGIAVPILATLLYAIERLKITVLMAKNTNTINIKGLLISALDENTIDRVYKGLIVLTFIIAIIFCAISIFALFALIPILLYNGERKVERKRLKLGYYIFFPVHHLLLYGIAMLLKGGIV